MFIKDANFTVEFSNFAEKHFCKSFYKKYRQKWVHTRQTIEFDLQRVFFLFQKTQLIDNIKFSQEEDLGIFKLDFRVAGTNISPKASGNRVIFSLCNKSGYIEILLVYGKNHCSKKQSAQSELPSQSELYLSLQFVLTVSFIIPGLLNAPKLKLSSQSSPCIPFPVKTVKGHN